MEMKREILELEDVKLLVDTFCQKVQADALLSPIFSERIDGHWPQHLEKMRCFYVYQENDQVTKAKSACGFTWIRHDQTPYFGHDARS